MTPPDSGPGDGPAEGLTAAHGSAGPEDLSVADGSAGPHVSSGGSAGAQVSTGAVNPSTAMATTVVDELVRQGLRRVVLAPGSRSTALAVALASRDDVELVVRHDERSAAFLALGLTRATGVPTAVVTTSGTAVSNLGPAVAEAHTAGVPLVLLTADRPAELHHVGANQAFGQADLFHDLVRWRVDFPAAADVPGEPRWWRSTIARAWAAALGRAGAGTLPPDAGGPAGPVHCNLAFREPTVPGLDDGRSRALPYRQALDMDASAPTAGDATNDPVTVPEDLLDRLDGRRVLVVAGDSPRPVVGLADLVAAGVPVLAEPTAGTRLGVGTPHASVVLAAAVDDPELRPDVVLRLGRPTLSRAALVGLADVETVQVTAAGVVDPTHAVDHVYVVDPGDLLVGVAGRWAGDEEFGARWVAASRTAAAVVADHLDGPDAPEPAVARRVAGAAGGRHLVVASSLPIRDVADVAVAPATPTGRVHANRGLAGIDGFTSTAVGVALAGGPTVALAGDLSFLHDHNGLLVEDPAMVPLTLVVVDNDGGGIFHQVPAARLDRFERLFGTPHGRDLAAIARAAGIPAEPVGVDEVAEAVGRPSDGMQVLVVRTDRVRGAVGRRAVVADLADRLGSGPGEG